MTIIWSRFVLNFDDNSRFSHLLTILSNLRKILGLKSKLLFPNIFPLLAISSIEPLFNTLRQFNVDLSVECCAWIWLLKQNLALVGVHCWQDNNLPFNLIFIKSIVIKSRVNCCQIIKRWLNPKHHDWGINWELNLKYY